MNRHSLPLFMLLVFLIVPSADAALPDKSLDKPVTLAIKGEALCDIMPILERQTGVRLRVGKEIADQKATIFVDDKPLRQVMEGLSTLFGYHWTKKTFSTGDIYELWQDEKSRQRLADRNAKAWEAAWKAAIADIEFKSRLAVMSKEERDVLRRQLSDGSRATLPEAKTQLEAIRSVEQDPFLGAGARIFSGISPEALDMLRPGVKIIYNSLSPESEWVLPEDRARALLEAMNTHGTGWLPDGDIASIGVTFSCAENQRAVDITAILAPTVRTAPRSFSTSNMATWLTYQRVFEYLPSEHVSLPKAADLTALQKPVTIGLEDIVKETGREPESGTSPKANRTDILAILHRKLGLQVISDHYSQWQIWRALSDTTAIEILKTFDSPLPNVPVYEAPATWGWDGKLLCMRTKDIWYSDAAEIPNRLLRKWASSYRDRGYLDLFEQAEIAALTAERSAQLMMNREHLGLRKDTGTASTPALRLFGLLSDRQQREALASGARVNAFAPEQHRALSALLSGSTPLVTIDQDGILTSPVGVWSTGSPGYRLDKPEPERTGSPVSVAVWEGVAPSAPEGVAVVTQGSFLSSDGSPGTIVLNKGLGGLSTGKPDNVNYTMAISFVDSSALKIGITIPGGVPGNADGKETDN